MGRLMGMITRVAMWGAFGAALGFAGVVIYQVAFTGGALKHSFSSGTAHTAAASRQPVTQPQVTVAPEPHPQILLTPSLRRAQNEGGSRALAEIVADCLTR